MTRLGRVAYSVAIAGIALLAARELIEPRGYLYQQHDPKMVALGAVGWSIATLCPLFLSIWVWRLVRRSRRPWLLHLAFIPCALAAYRLGETVMFFAADVPDGDSVEGYTLLPAISVLGLVLLVHITILATLGFEKMSRRLDRR